MLRGIEGTEPIQSGTGELKADLIAACTYLKETWKSGGVNLFSLVADGKGRGNSCQLQLGKFGVDIKKNF